MNSMGNDSLHQNENIIQTNTQTTTPSTEVLSMQNMNKGSRQGGSKNNKKVYQKEKNDNTNNTSDNNKNNTSPNKKSEKTKLSKLCDDHHLAINCPKLTEVNKFLNQNTGPKKWLVYSIPSFPKPTNRC